MIDHEDLAAALFTEAEFGNRKTFDRALSLWKKAAPGIVGVYRKQAKRVLALLREAGDVTPGVTKCPVYAVLCQEHGGIVHGMEAEELRAGIEELIAGADDSVDEDARVVSAADLQSLVDKVDARDSLAYREATSQPGGATKEHEQK